MAERARVEARVGGYVLAGGRSSRMGHDKALLPLAGRPLIAHAVARLRRVAGEANILAGAAPGDPALRPFGPLVFDASPGCGPLAGIEAALRHSTHDWNLILPVDVPFLPAAFLDVWVTAILAKGDSQPPIALFRVGDVVQPSLLMIRRRVAPVLSAALAAGEFKLFPVFQRAAAELARPDAPAHEAGPSVFVLDDSLQFAGSSDLRNPGEPWPALTEAQRRAQPLWFANLNTPREFAEAEQHVDVLDPLE